MSDELPDFLTTMPLPPTAKLLGWTFVSFDADKAALTVEFDGREEFLNPAGVVQGGILAAMLDDTMGPALMLSSRGEAYSTSIDINISYLAPALPGRLTCIGRVVRAGKTIAFLEGELFAADGTLLARATSSARVLTGTPGR